MDKKSFVPLLDMFLLIICILFVIIALMKVEQQKEQDIETKAEYIITVTWPDGNKNDVDTWLRNPSDKICWYQSKDVGLMSLDRDDLGWQNDYISLSNGTRIENPYNQEIVSIRQIIEGYWLLNVHMYRMDDNVPTKVHVKIEKLNPKVKTLYYASVVLERLWQEITIAKFHIDIDGDFTFIDNTYEELAKATLTRR